MTALSDSPACRILPSAYRDALAQAAGAGPLYIAYSGGLDSRFLCFSAMRLGYAVSLLHVTGPHIAPQETTQAQAWAHRQAAPLQTVFINPLEIADLAQIGRDRCYVCKKHLFTRLLTFTAGVLCDGTNASDAAVFRPGARALAELHIRSPLAQGGLTKAAIRTLAAALGMDDPQQAARPCLLTRFPYFTAPPAQTLVLIAQAEAFISARPDSQALRFRLRFPHPDTPELHIEKQSAEALPADALSDLRTAVAQHFPALSGLRVVLLDRLSGFYDSAL